MNNRWYDKDPVVKQAVTYLEQADSALKDYCCDFIIERSRNSGYVITVNNFEYYWQRWQDHNVKHFLAMEYLRIVDDETKSEICSEIVKYIESLTSKEEK